MKATILLGTLSKEGLSNTQVLSEFLAHRLEKRSVDTQIIRLAERNILPGTCRSMGTDDAWPEIQDALEASDIIVFATPIWWNTHSSELQRAIERLDEVHDEILSGKKSRFDGKAGGIVVTGDSDGAQSLIGSIANFYNAIGIALPPYATLTVLNGAHAKGKNPTREELLSLYEKEYGDTADTMVERLMSAVRA